MRPLIERLFTMIGLILAIAIWWIRELCPISFRMAIQYTYDGIYATIDTGGHEYRIRARSSEIFFTMMFRLAIALLLYQLLFSSCCLAQLHFKN